MITLAMDLSLSCPAFAVLEANAGRVDVLHLSHIKTDAKKSRGYRLFQIYNHMKAIYEKYPEIRYVVREKGFSKFPSVTQTLFQVVGISTVCAYNYGHDDIAEIAPTSVKKAVTGNGKASKEQVAQALLDKFGLNLVFGTNDESDAVGVGIAFLKQKKALA